MCGRFLSLPWKEREAASTYLKKEYGFKVSKLIAAFLFVFLFSSKGLKFQKRFMIAFSQSFIHKYSLGFYSDNFVLSIREG